MVKINWIFLYVMDVEKESRNVGRLAQMKKVQEMKEAFATNATLTLEPKVLAVCLTTRATQRNACPFRRAPSSTRRITCVSLYPVIIECGL